jgi:hypothetical protein
MLKGPAAFELGMADAMFAPAEFLEASIEWAGKVVSGEVTVSRPEISRDEAVWQGAIAASTMLADLKTGKQSPAPLPGSATRRSGPDGHP